MSAALGAWRTFRQSSWRSYSVVLGAAAAAAGLAGPTYLALAKDAPGPADVQLPAGEANARVKRVAVIGSGWASVSFLNNLKADAHVEVTVISPRGYFLYSPLLPAVAVGAIEARSVMEPIRTFLPSNAKFYEAEASTIDPVNRTITCRSKLVSGPGSEFQVGYDVLVLAAGSVNNSFGTPGVQENCFFLKTAEDAARFRSQVHNMFERSALPTTSPEERARLLTFVVCGGGPTGAELAAELLDLLKGDMMRMFPDLAKISKVVLVDSNSHILSMFDRVIAEHTTAKFRQTGIQLILQSRVTAVEPDGVTLLHKRDGSQEKLGAGTVVWATGLGLHPLVAGLAKALPPGSQPNLRALTVDSRLAVCGSGGSVYALGDMATVQQELAVAHAAELFQEFDADGNGRLDIHELTKLLGVASNRYPQLREHMRLLQQQRPAPPPAPAAGKAGGAAAAPQATHARPALLSSLQSLSLLHHADAESLVEAMLHAADRDGDGMLSMVEFKALLTEMDKHLRTLPATAQVARQQGIYLAGVANAGMLGPRDGAALAPAPAFHWSDMGSMAFVGSDEAVAKLPGIGVVKGLAAGALWRGFELLNQQSWRNRVAVGLDMTTTKVFGRDTTSMRS